jgi:hypothetical protein
MGAHARVLAALGELDAQQRFQPGGTGIQVARGEDQVIGFDHR